MTQTGKPQGNKDLKCDSDLKQSSSGKSLCKHWRNNSWEEKPSTLRHLLQFYFKIRIKMEITCALVKELFKVTSPPFTQNIVQKHGNCFDTMLHNETKKINLHIGPHQNCLCHFVLIYCYSSKITEENKLRPRLLMLIYIHTHTPLCHPIRDPSHVWISVLV